MPWTVKDVDKFKKGLTDKQKNRWVSIANSALKECTAQGGDNLECEVSAIRIANSRVGSHKNADVEHKTRFIEGVHETNDGIDIETRMILSLGAEADDDDDEYQMVLPVGLFHDGWYGEIIITNSFADLMIDHWRNKVLGNREPFIDTNHDRGAANGWIEDLESRDTGVFAKINWTKQGHEYIEDELYKYFSAEIGRVTQIDDGLPAFPVLIAVALCNTPVMNIMPQAHLSDQWSIPNVSIIKPNTDTNPADLSITPDTNDTGGYPVETFAEVLRSLLSLSDEEKGKATDADRAMVAQTIGITIADPTAQEKQSLLVDENKRLSTELSELKGKNLDERIDRVITAAKTEGKILPANEERWRKLMVKDPDGTEELLTAKGPEIDLETHGHGGGGEESKVMSDNEHKVHNAFGHTQEDIEKYGG